MPIYEYTCDQCSSDFEFLTRGDQKPECPKCGGTELTRKLSVPAAHVANSGPACPAREMGACGAMGCGGGQCGLANG
jgi:putative FmdB family regulatory protein